VVSAVAGVRRVDRRVAEAGSLASAGGCGCRAGDRDQSRVTRVDKRRCDVVVAEPAVSSEGESERPERRRRGASLDGDGTRGERVLLRLAAALPAVAEGASMLVRVRSRPDVGIDLARGERARDRAGVSRPRRLARARHERGGGAAAERPPCSIAA